MLSLGRIIYGSFAAFLPSMTSRLQDVASAADPVLSGCVSRQGPAFPSGPAPRLTDDNSTTLCLRELWEKKKKIGRPDPLSFPFFLPPPRDRARRSSAEHDRGRQREKERRSGREREREKETKGRKRWRQTP